MLVPVAVTHYLGRFKNKPFVFFSWLECSCLHIWEDMTLVPPSRFTGNKLPVLVDFLSNPTAGQRIRAMAAPPAALRSAVAALISILALSFRFMSVSLTCFKPAVYRHLLPPPSSSCLFALFTLCFDSFFVPVGFSFVVLFFGGGCASSAHLSTSFLFSFSSCLDSYSVFKWTKPKVSGFLCSFSLKTLQRPQTATSCPFYSCPVYFVSPAVLLDSDVAGILSESNFTQLQRTVSCLR